MVKHSMDLLELLRKRGIDGDVDFLREALRVLVDGIMDAEVSAQIGAQHGERSPERVTYRNGYRNRTWDTRVGTMALHIPKLREGSYFPSLLEPRRRSEKALLSVIQQAYVGGAATAFNRENRCTLCCVDWPKPTCLSARPVSPNTAPQHRRCRPRGRQMYGRFRADGCECLSRSGRVLALAEILFLGRLAG